MTAKLRVALVYDEDGNIEVYHDKGVEVIAVCDFAPSDRLYRMEHNPIPDGLLDGPIGSKNDGSAAHDRAEYAADLMAQGIDPTAMDPETRH